MFGESGIIRVDGAFSADAADSMSELIWTLFGHHFGMRREDPRTWGIFRKRPLDSIGAAPLFDEILTDRLAAVVDEILGAGAWDWPQSWGDFLITFPDTASWTLPHTGWHQDWTFATDCDPPRFVKTFAFLNEVGPGGGGTLVVAGSHRLRERFAADSDALYRDCAWLRDLCSPGDPAARRRRFMAAETEVEGVGLRVVELTGRPGDVVAIHPWLVHAIAPNASQTPRFMRAPVFATKLRVQ